MTTDHQGSWFKSSYSGGNNPSCVEARFSGGGIDIRDSKAPEGSVLRFGPDAWQKFLDRLAS